MTLPSFHNLPIVVNAPNGSTPGGTVHKMSNGRERLPDIPPELWARIQYYIGADCNLDSLMAILQWCQTNSTNWKACDEKWYKHVLETCVGAKPGTEVPLEPDAGMLHRMVDDDRNPVVALGDGYWRRMLVKCVCELEQLPQLMSAAYLRSNEAQRARWASVFERRGMYALRARVVMADEPIPAQEKRDEFSFPDYYEFVGIGDDERSARIGFMKGEETTLEFENTVKKWIEEGWKFDWLFGELFKTNLDSRENWRTNSCHGKKYEKVDAWISLLRAFQYSYFIPRMHMLLEHGIDHVIPWRDMILAIPNVVEMECEDHYQLEVLSSNIQLLVDYKIKVESESVYTGAIVEKLMKAIVVAYVELPKAIKRWEEKLRNENNTDEYTKSTYTEHFRRYEVVVPQRLVELMVHLVHPHGNTDWHVARKYTMSNVLNYDFLSDAHKAALDAALVSTGVIYAPTKKRKPRKPRN